MNMACLADMEELLGDQTLHLLQYGDANYWEERYTAQSTVFDWYQGYLGLQHLLAKYVPKAASILHVSDCSEAGTEGNNHQHRFFAAARTLFA